MPDEMKAETAEIEAQPAAALLAWYARHRRSLPWRASVGTPDPYAVWLSEIMLQQTNVTTVKPYYADFLARWPTVERLAAAPLEEVMKAWAGLGYYARARNLHACAIAVVERYGGLFPQTEAELRTLPGVGTYTAAAVAAIAFGRHAVVIDGNVERVVARLFAIDVPMPAAKVPIRSAAESLTPNENCGDFAQAMMDLGSMVCTPRDPACALCPLAAFCRARATAAPDAYPVKAPKTTRPLRIGAAFYIRRADGQVLVRTREARGLLGGMTEIPGTPWLDEREKQVQDLLADVPAPLAVPLQPLSGEVEHVFTHFALRLRVYVGEAPIDTEPPAGFRFVPASVLDAEALPSLMRKVVAHARAPEFSDLQRVLDPKAIRVARRRSSATKPKRP
jgi:A/G-specific adenine glycosylase